MSPPLITLEGERRRSERRAPVQSERASIAGSPHYIPSRRVIPREGRKHIVAFCQSRVSEFRRSFVCWLRSPLGFFCFPFVSCFLLRRLIFIFLNQVSPSFLSLGLVPALKLSSFICCLGIRFFFFFVSFIFPLSPFSRRCLRVRVFRDFDSYRLAFDEGTPRDKCLSAQFSLAQVVYFFFSVCRFFFSRTRSSFFTTQRRRGEGERLKRDGAKA